MAKTVVTNREVPHLWANQAQSYASNSTRTQGNHGSLYFRDSVIYSWRDSYPIGHIVGSPRKGCKDKLVLIQENRYSSSTSGHIAGVERAVSHMQSVHVPHLLTGYSISQEHEQNVQWFHERIAETVNKALHARTSVEWWLRRIEHFVEQGNLYAHFFKLKAKFKAEMKVKARETAKVKAAKDASDIIRRKAQQERADIIYRPIAQAKLDAWRNGGPRPSSEDARVLGMTRENNGDLLRVMGDVVETSQGAEFPVSHARLGLALVKRVMDGPRYQMRRCAANHDFESFIYPFDTPCPYCAEPLPSLPNGPSYLKDWRTNGHTLHLGHYKIDRVTGDGTVYAGCHIVKWSEIERIAGQLEPQCTCTSSQPNDRLNCPKHGVLANQ